MKKLLLPIVIILINMPCNWLLNGQTPLAGTQTRNTDSIPASEEVTKKHSLYTMAGYGSTAIYPGSSLTGSQKFSIASLIYSYRNKLFTSVSSIDLLNNGIPADYITPSLIYIMSPAKWLDISMTASGFKINGNYADSLKQDFALADITTGFNPRFMKTDISFSWLYSGNSSYFIQIRNSRTFQTRSFFKNRLSISFTPYINILAGSHYRSVTESVTTSLFTSDSVSVMMPENQQITDINGNRSYSGTASSATGYSTVVTRTTMNTTASVTSIKKRFGVMEFSAGLPVTANFRRFSLEAEAGYVLPAYSDNLVPRPKGFMFMFTGLIRLF